MGDETTSGGATGQAPETPTAGQAPAADTDQASGTTQVAQQSQQTEGAPTASEIAALRRENADYRKRLKALETSKSEAAQASMTELERAQHRVAELEAAQSEAVTREQDRNVRLEAVEQAVKLNFRSPDLAYRLIDRSEVEFDDGNTPKNVAKLLKAIVEREPYLTKGSGADFGGGNRGPAPAQADMNSIIRRAAGRN